MRALMKGNAAQYFQKKQKIVEDPEAKLNQLQAKIMAKYIGIDQSEIEQYSSFFDQIRKIKLPKGYHRYMSTDKTKIFYVNQQTGDSDTMHPSIDIIKVAFYHILSDASSVHTFSVKANRLLPFVQQKMIKQCIGLSSKRRDAEKANMQRDETGKIVMSKQARIKPDIKGLISSRSYMLKALVEKVFTKKQLWGKGKKANVYAAILAAQRGSDKGEGDQKQTEQSLQFYEQIYRQSKKFYEEHYGNVNFIPEQLKLTKQYYKSTPDSVLRNLNILNIDKFSLELYWFARLMECLPLPPGWSLKVGDTYSKFYYEPKKIYFDLHPSYIYIIEQMNDFKQSYSQMDIIQQNYYNNMKEMVFYDFFQRPYNVDLFAFAEKIDSLPVTKKKAIKKSQELGRNDWMALDGIKNSGLMPQNYVLIQDILQYWKSLNYRQDNYTPAISPFGQVVWSSTINQKTIQFCPHAQILRVIIQQKSMLMPKVNQKDLKNFQQKLVENPQQFQRNLQIKRQKFLKHYIRHDPKPLSQPYQLPAQYNQNQFFNSVFISPFNFDLNLQSQLNLNQNEQAPIWIQKVHAKKNTDLFHAMMNEQPENFTQIKEKFKDYALDMIRKYQPNRQQDIKNVVDRIETKPQLKKFILHINDIDSRQQRIRLAAIGDEEQEKNSFDSQISQIEMQQDSQSEQEEDEIIDVEVPDDVSQQNKQEVASSSESQTPQKQTHQHLPISEASQQSDSQQRVPEKYISIVYQKDKNIEKLTDFELEKKIKQQKNQKILKHKYSRSNIKQAIHRYTDQYIESGLTNQQLKNRKRNLLISNFQSQHAPYNISPTKIRHNNLRLMSAPNNLIDVSQEFSVFQSQTSVLGNEDIDSDMRKYQQINARRREEERLNQLNQKKNNVDETKETIELQPIKRIKPDIAEDPRLMHISKFKEAVEFRKTFNPDVKQQLKMKLTAKLNLKSQKQSLEETNASSKFNPEISLFSSNSQKQKTLNSTKNDRFDANRNRMIEKVNQDEQQLNYNQPRDLRKSQSVLSLSNTSISPTKFNSRYNRVCLGNTGNHLLSTEPLTKRGDLVTIQARKSLISKGRGMQTFLSKKY